MFDLFEVLPYKTTVKIWKPEKFAVINLKFEQGGFTMELMHPNDAEGMANSVDLDQTSPSAV